LGTLARVARGRCCTGNLRVQKFALSGLVMMSSVLTMSSVSMVGIIEGEVAAKDATDVHESDIAETAEDAVDESGAGEGIYQSSGGVSGNESPLGTRDGTVRNMVEAGRWSMARWYVCVCV
jgi:hypothetical protein